METLIFKSISVYALTLIITSSSIFETVRDKIKKITPYLKIGNHKHFIECRMCVSFWCTLIIINVEYKIIISVLTIYGLSYFLATQERK